MEFDKRELMVIYAMLEVSHISLQRKKRKNKQDIMVLKESKALMEKINNFMESEEKKE